MIKLPAYFEFKIGGSVFEMTLDTTNGKWCCELANGKPINNGKGFWSLTDIKWNLVNGDWKFVHPYGFISEEKESRPYEKNEILTIVVEFNSEKYLASSFKEAQLILESLESAWTDASSIEKYRLKS